MTAVQEPAGRADVTIMSDQAPGQRRDVPCDREHLDQLRAPSSDVAVPHNPAALESVAALLAHVQHAA
jgi:hypothetical protein